jgi:hypothetical protein
MGTHAEPEIHGIRVLEFCLCKECVGELERRAHRFCGRVAAVVLEIVLEVVFRRALLAFLRKLSAAQP